MTKKPIVAGVLVLVASFYMILFLSLVLFVGGGMYPDKWKVIVFWILSLMVVGTGIFSLFSGFFTLGRKKWRLAVAGSISIILIGLIVTGLDRYVLEVGTYSIFSLVVSLIPTLLTIPALILLILSKKEFGDTVS